MGKSQKVWTSFEGGLILICLMAWSSGRNGARVAGGQMGSIIGFLLSAMLGAT